MVFGRYDETTISLPDVDEVDLEQAIFLGIFLPLPTVLPPYPHLGKFSLFGAEVVEFEIQTQQDYFDYAHEYLAVFDRAYDEVQPAFARHKDYSNETSRETKGTNAP